MYSESLRVFFVGAFERHHSFIRSFNCRTNLICALEEGGKEDGDDDAREQQHA